MGNSSSKGPTVTEHDRAILQLKRQRDRLQQYQTKIGAVLRREHQLAAECVARGDRARALLALRKRKQQQTMLDQTLAQLATLDELITTIEFKLVEKDVVQGLERGAQVLQQLSAEVLIERVERLMDDTAEGVAYQQEVSEMLGTALSPEMEDEVEDELAALEREVAGPSSVAQPVLPEMPSVPHQVPLPDAPTSVLTPSHKEPRLEA